MALLSGTAVITGAGSGIGQAVAIAFARAGCQNLVLADLSTAGMQKTNQYVQEYSPATQTLLLEVDVASQTSVNDMIAATVNAFGAVNYGINVAGISCTARVDAMLYPISEYDAIQSVNTRGLFFCVQAELKAMVHQTPHVTLTGCNESRAQRGSIVNIASVCGSTGIPKISPYTVSKHAVVGLTRAVAIDHAKDGIRVNAVAPGLVETPMIDTRRKHDAADQSHRGETVEGDKPLKWQPADIYNTPWGRLALAEEVADACVFLSSSMSSHTTGSLLTVDGGRSIAY